MKPRKAVTFFLIDEYFEMVRFNAGSVGKNKSEIIQRLAKLGAQILFVENLYVKDEKKYENGLIACNYLKNMSVGVEVIPFKNIRYRMESTFDAENIIKEKLKGPNIKVCMTFDPGFSRYLDFLKKEYKWSMSYSITLLLQYGTALTNCLKDTDHYSQLALSEFEKIKNYSVQYDPTGDNIILNKIVGNTQINFNEINPAGSQDLQVMSKYTPSTRKDRKEYS